MTDAMNQMRTLLIGAAFLGTVAATGCGGDAPLDDEEAIRAVTTEWYEALNDDRFRDALKLLDAQSRDACTLDDNIEEKLRIFAFDEGKFLDFVFFMIDGATARARVLISIAGGTEIDFVLGYVKEGDSWRINVSAPGQRRCPIGF